MATLLIVDDDRDVCDVLAEIFRDEGFQVATATNGAEGLRYFDERGALLPDAILLDVEMPVLNGPSMAHRLFIADMGRERVPVVLLAGVANLSQVAAAVGTPYFLEKPLELSKLLALVGRALAERVAPNPACEPRRAPNVGSSGDAY